jgi:septal ring factor EnvC (AmiA/AmiB activator)
MAITLITVPALAQDPRDAQSKLTQAKEQERSLLSELAVIDQGLSVLQTELRSLNTQTEEIAIEQIKQQQQLKNIGQQFQKVENTLIEKTNLLYKIHRRGLARIIFGAESPIDLRRRSTYLKMLIESDKDRLDEIRSLAKERKKVVDGLNRSQKQLTMLEEKLNQKKKSLDADRTKKQDFLTSIQQEKSLAMQLLRERQQAQTAFTNTISTVQSKPSPSTQAAPTTFANSYGQLPWPVQGTLLRRFGKQTDPFTGNTVKSNGIDIQAAPGSTVTAVFDGSVALAKFIDTYGQTVVINHGRYSTVYAHLSGVNVRQGQRVSAGTPIGLVGNSGITDAQNSHWLSFEIRYNKSPQDPLSWLKQ